MWRLALKVGVSLALLWLLLRHRDLGALLNQMAAVGRGGLLGAGALTAVCTVILAARWSVILGALGAPRGLRITLPLILVGRFFSQALPSGIGGDVVRMWLGCKAGLSSAVSISSVMADRLTGLFALLLIVTAETPALRRLSPAPAVTDGVYIVLLAGYGGFLVVLALDRLPRGLHRFRIIRGFRQFSRDLRTIMLSARAGWSIILSGLLAQGCDLLAVFALAWGLGLPVSLSDCLAIVPLSNLVQALPISIAGWGVRESFFVAAFGMTGIAATDALVISILFGLLNLLVSLPGGVLWLMQGNAAPREIPGGAAKEAEPASGN